MSMGPSLWLKIRKMTELGLELPIYFTVERGFLRRLDLRRARFAGIEPVDDS